MRSIFKIATVCALLTAGGQALAQDLGTQIGDGSAAPGGSTEATLDLVTAGTGVHTVQVDIDVSSETPFSDIRPRAYDVFNSGAPTSCSTPVTVAPNVTVTCSNPSSGIYRFIIENGTLSEIGDISYGEIQFDVDGGASAPQTIDLTFAFEEYSSGATPPFTSETPNVSDPGQIEILNIAPNLSLSETGLTFSTAISSTSAAQTVDACNNGNADGLTFSDISISGADAANFSQTNNCPTSSPGLAQGTCCQIDTTFSPDAITSFTASLDVTSSNGSGSVTLDGTGTAGPAATLSISDATYDFGDVLTGDSATYTFTVSNTGEADSEASIDTITPPAGDFSVTGGSCSAGTTTLADGESCTIDLQFAPAADGLQSGDLVVDGTDTVNSTSLQVTSTVEGNGVTEARFVSSPAAGNVNVGLSAPGGSLSQVVTISNEGNADLTVNNCTFDDPSGNFSISPDPIDFTIAPDASSDFTVSCDVPEPGSFSATLSCDTNDSDNNPVSYTFTCNGQVLEVPTMQPWGLVTLTLIMLMIGGLSIRYFRA